MANYVTNHYGCGVSAAGPNSRVANGYTASGWERDENGALRRVKKPHMGRRLPGFDYSQRMIYEITIVLKERRPVLGRLVKKPCESAALEDGAGNEPTWVVEPSAMGQAALECWRKITDFWPQVSLIEAQLIPEHFHDILFVKERLPLTHPDKPEGPDNRRKNLGDIIRGFKVGCTMAWRELINGGEYAAIGNHFLLARPRLVQVQCSRKFFRYRVENSAKNGRGPDLAKYGRRRDRKPRICRDEKGNPIVELSTPEFEAKLSEALSAGRHGAVLVSPCISHGEREIARRAFEAGYRVITLQNKGFSPLYKPGGKLFTTCANGNLLMLAPIDWPYIPGEKPMTREQAQVLNRIAQLIAGDGAAVIDYKGAVMHGIDEQVAAAVDNCGKYAAGPNAPGPNCLTPSAIADSQKI